MRESWCRSPNFQLGSLTIELVPRFLIAGLALLCAVTFVTAGCTSPSNNPETPSATSQASDELDSSQPAPKFVEGGSAFENLEYFNYMLRKAIRGGATVDGVSMVNAVVDAGFDKSLMQVSFDKSQTGLRADNIFVSVRVNDQCLIGQVVTADKTVTTSVQPVVGPEKTICLIGKTRPIDW